MNRRATIAFALDALCVVVFVAIGRRTHDEGGNVATGAAKVAAPFLIALIVAWLISRAWRDPFSNANACIIWLTTVIAGLLLRRVVFERGTATPFVMVATATLCAFILGWRALARWRLPKVG
jgi:chromate transport protein ChrA